MGNVIKNDMAALRSLNQLNKNSQLLGKSLQRVASGMKINSAADSASAYSISEKMRIQIRALNQCSDNTKTGSDMLKIAEGAVDNQIDLIKRMKEIALDAANDTNTDVDRATMQKEVNARMMELNDISYSTNYNGRQLLNGAVPGTQVTQFNAGANPVQNTTPIVTEPPTPGDPNKYNGAHNQSYNLPVYDAGSYYTGKVYDPNTTVWTQMTSTASIVAGSTVYDSQGNPYTTFADANNNNAISVTINGVNQVVGMGFTPYEQTLAPVSVGNLTNGAQYVRGNNQYPASPQDIKTYTPEYLPDGKTQILNDSPVNGGNPSFYDIKLPSTNLPTSLDQQGFSMICNAGCAQFVAIQFDVNAPADTATYYKDPNSQKECYVVGIAGCTTVDDVYKSMQAGITAEAIKVVSQAQGSNPVQISANHGMSLNFYTDQNNNVRVYAMKDGGELDLYDGVIGQIETTGGRRPYQNLTIQGDTTASQYTNLHFPNTTLDALFPSQTTDWDIEPTDADYPDPWPAGYEEDRTWPPEWGEDYIKTSTLDAKRKRLFREEVWPYPVKGALSSGTCVSTREKATKFISSLDQALKYLTNAATTLGVQRTRLEAMNDNIVTSHENTTSAESVIRDADMAKEMYNYTKYNVLSQAAQSMLSQANQNTSGSLNLLQ